MEHRQFGATDMQVSVLGFGGAEIGFASSPVDNVSRLLQAALDNGLNVIDTAECYGTGEELLGKAVAHRRNEFHLFTKCGHGGLREELPTDVQSVEDWDARLLNASIERSLRRLQTDHVDLLQLHSCDEEILRRGEVIEVLERARDAGKTRYIGYSGDNEAALYAVECGRFDTLQTSLNVADQRAIELFLPQALERNMGVIAKRPIANVAWKYSSAEDAGYGGPYWERFQELQYPFLQGEMNAAVAQALQFTLHVPGVHTAIVGTSNPERWPQNAALLKQSFSDEEYQAIRARWQEIAASDWVAQT